MRTHRWLVGVVLVGVLGTVSGLTAGCSGSPTPSAPHVGSMMGGHRLPRLTCSPPATLPGTAVHVMLGDLGMARGMYGPTSTSSLLQAFPTRVPAGRVSLVVSNMGRRTHELVVLPLGPGQAAGRRAPVTGGRIDEAGSLGEVSASCAAGAGSGIRPGAVGWGTLDLAAGHYELVCNLPHHYERGMHQELTVT